MNIMYPFKEIQEEALVSAMETVCGSGVSGESSFQVNVVSGTAASIKVSPGKAWIGGRYVESTTGWAETVVGVTEGEVGVWLVFDEGADTDPVALVVSTDEPTANHIALASVVMAAGQISEVNDMRNIIKSLIKLSKGEDTGWQALSLNDVVSAPQSLAGMALSEEAAISRVRKIKDVVFLELACQIKPANITGLEGALFGAKSAELTVLPEEFRPAKELVFSPGFYKTGTATALETAALVAVKEDGRVVLYANNYADSDLAPLIQFHVHLNTNFLVD